jgi:hypothetical protein
MVRNGRKLAMATGVEMSDLSEGEIRALFKAMHTKGTSTNNVATLGRSNSAEPYSGDNFVAEFEAMLDRNFEIAKEVLDRFGA